MLPEGARVIEVSEFLTCIGELYFQNWTLRQAIQKQQAQQFPQPPNGAAHAIPEQFKPAQ